MLRHCMSPRDWASKLPAIKFTLNTAGSKTTGFFQILLNYGLFLYYGWLPQSMVWYTDSEYPGIRVFAQNMRNTIMRVHDAIIVARVKQTELANWKQKEVPFVKVNLASMSIMSHITLPKGHAQNLAPMFIGPFKILDKYKNNMFSLDLPPKLKQWGVHYVFHANMLWIYIPDDDRCFPRRQMP